MACETLQTRCERLQRAVNDFSHRTRFDLDDMSYDEAMREIDYNNSRLSTMRHITVQLKSSLVMKQRAAIRAAKAAKKGGR